MQAFVLRALGWRDFRLMVLGFRFVPTRVVPLSFGIHIEVMLQPHGEGFKIVGVGA